jgi:opacity protein-like surface antigen
MGASFFQAQAATKKNKKSVAAPAASLRQQAEAEQNVPVSSSEATPATIHIQEMKPLVLPSSWTGSSNFGVQMFQPSGQAIVRRVSQYQLEQIAAGTMPSLSLRMNRKLNQDGERLWDLGLRAMGGWMSQSASLAVPSGQVIDDAKLNTSLLVLGLDLGVRIASTPKLRYFLQPQYGQVTYVMTSLTPEAQFTQWARFAGAAVGAEWMFANNWTSDLEYTYWVRQQESLVDIPRNNFRAGLGYTW